VAIVAFLALSIEVLAMVFACIIRLGNMPFLSTLGLRSILNTTLMRNAASLFFCMGGQGDASPMSMHLVMLIHLSMKQKLGGLSLFLRNMQQRLHSNMPMACCTSCTSYLLKFALIMLFFTGPPGNKYAERGA
jgi:hypothetical protein